MPPVQIFAEGPGENVIRERDRQPENDPRCSHSSLRHNKHLSFPFLHRNKLPERKFCRSMADMR